MGGSGFGSSISGYLNDVWVYNPATNNWTWENGSNTVNAPSVISGIPTAVKPGARMNTVSWADENMAYIMGGFGKDVNNFTEFLNDLWQYNLTTRLWTFLKGSAIYGQLGVYGSQGVPNSLNNPGSRFAATAWVYNKKLYLFGGRGYASSGSPGELNDLWEYKPSTNNWTWLKGSFATEQGGVYGTQGVYNASNVAGARNSTNSFLANNKIYLFGGIGYGSGIGTGGLNDLWEYTPACTEVYSVTSGDWNNASTWSCNQVPTLNDRVEIKATHIINLNNSSYTFKSLLLNGNITLGQSSGSLKAN